MIEFTDNAYAKLVERLSNEKTKAIRFGVTGGGCTGHKYIFDICTSIDKTDYCVDFGKFKVYIDRLSSEYVIDTVIDWKTEGLNEEFDIQSSRSKFLWLWRKYYTLNLARKKMKYAPYR